MIVIDTSAMIAILRDDPERRTFTEALEQAEQCLMSAVSFVESSLVRDPGYLRNDPHDLGES
jgi:ribonuclease VapC